MKHACFIAMYTTPLYENTPAVHACSNNIAAVSQVIQYSSTEHLDGDAGPDERSVVLVHQTQRLKKYSKGGDRHAPPF